MHQNPLLRLFIPIHRQGPGIHVPASFLRLSALPQIHGFTSKYNPSCHTATSDIFIPSTDTLIFHLKCSKTNQSGPPQPIYLFHLDSPQTYTSIHRLQACQQSFPPGVTVFVTETGKVATHHWFHCHLRQILSQSGISPDQYSGLSFRISATASASKQGILDHIIKTLGRWSSPAYHTYIHNDINDIRNVHAHLSR